MQTNLKSFLQRIVRQKNKRRFFPMLLALLLGLAIVQPAQAADGDLDPGFGSGGKVTTSIGAGVDSAVAVAIDANNKIVVAGTSNNGENDDFALARYNSDGTLDASFDGDGIVTTPVGTGNDAARAVAIDANGKILVAGRSHNGANYDFALVRYNSDGTLDASFDNDGIVTTDHGNADGAWAVVVDASGKIVVAGEANVDFALLRYNSDGSLDASFDGDGIVTTPIATGGGIGGTHDVATAVTIDGRGQIVAAGTGGGQLFELARYNNDGSLDATFDSDGKVSTDVSAGSPENARAVAVDANGKIVVAGTSNNGANNDFALVRYNRDGTLDTSFDGDGIVATPVGGGHDEGYAMAIDSNGKIVVAGTSHNGQNRDLALVRYTNDGALDSGFGVGGKVTTDFGTGITVQDYGYAVAIEGSGKIVVAGQVGNDFALARYSGENGPLVSHCNQQGFLAAVQSGEASGTITLDGNCRYLLTSSAHTWSGGNSGVLLINTTLLEGNSAIIERSADAPAFRILALAGQNNKVIRNVTIRNGKSTGSGGGLFVNGSLTLENVTLEGNSADFRGGAIASMSGDLSIDNSHLFNNQAGDYGGAIFKEWSVLNVTDTIFAQNDTKSDGAAIFVGGSVTEAEVINSTITDNAKNDGIAVIVWAPFTLRNTIIANHHVALQAGGKGNLISEDHNLFANTTSDVREAGGPNLQRGGNSTQVPDPQFVDPAALNYALKNSSPAVDKGTNTVLVSTPNLATDAANTTRPFSGTPVDIGAYELQAQGGPSLSIIKQGPPWVVPGVQTDYSLTIANDGVASAAALEVVDVLPTGAQYVAGSATGSGTFANGRLTWQIGSLAPGAKSFLQYKVTAAQTLVSDDYKVQSTSDPTAFYQGQAITTPLNTKVVAALDFYPRPDGFSFPNYTDSLDSDLTITDMIKYFGKEAACISEASPCVLKATVEAWRQRELAASKGGHCLGFSVASLDIFANATVAPGDFQSGANFTYDLTKVNARNYIMRYWAQQTLLPQVPPKDPQSGTPYLRRPITSSLQLLDTLINNFNDPNATERYSLNIAANDDKGHRFGHSVVPYAVEKRNDDENDHGYLIYVYDNNYPNDTTRTIRINRETGDWAYVTSLNPDAPTSTYKGGKDDDFIELASWQFDQTFPKVCPVCPPPATAASGNIAGASALQSGGKVEFQLDGEGYLLVTRSDGKRVGFDLTTGQWVTEIEGAEAVDVLTGLGLHIPPTIRIPHEAGKTYSIQVANGDTAYGNTEASANVNIFGAGFAVRLTELVLNSPIPQPISSGADGSVQTAALDQEPFDVMNLNFDPDAKLIVFETGDDDAETPSLSMAISKGQGPDYSVDVKNVNVEQGHAIALAFNEANQSITIEDDSAAQTDYQVELKRINPDGTTDTFVSDSVSDGGKAGVTLKVGVGWTGAAPDIQVEENSTLLAPDDANQEHAIFLPLVAR